MVIADVIKDIRSSTNSFIEVGFIAFNDVIIRTSYILNSSIINTVKEIVTSEENVVSTLESTFAKIIANVLANAKIAQSRHF